jgi:hypothetical protein
MLIYLRARHARAYADLKAFFIKHIAGSVALLIGAAIPIPGIRWIAGADPLQEFGLWFAYGVVGPLILSAGAWVYYYLRAGANIYAEQTARIAELEVASTTPDTSGKSPMRDVKVGEAIAYLVTNRWGITFIQSHDRAAFDIVPEFDLISEFRRFKQAAADGLITIWGCASHGRPHQPIPAGFWIENDICFSSLLKGDAESEPRNDRDFTQTRYLRLMASRVEVERFYRSQPPELMRAKSVARQLSKLHEAGVEQRNRLLAPLKPFDHDAEQGILVKWDQDVVSRFDSVDVPEGERSRFATLNTYCPEIYGELGRNPQQIHLETMWNKKLQILQSILDQVKLDQSHRTA